MAFMECRFHSDVLGRAMAMNVIVPQQAKTQIGMSSAGSGRKDYPVLYLLHGMMGDYCSWMRQSSIERYAAAYDVVVVMPDGERGFYTDMVTGHRYWTMLSEELPGIVANLFPVSTRREDTFAAGLSMGGYGALKLALRRPDRYAGAVALSAVADLRERFANPPPRDETRWLFGSADELIPRGNDLFALADNAVTAPAPLTDVWCQIVPPGHEPNPDNPVITLPRLDLAYDDVSGRFLVTYDGFTVPGTYTVTFYVRDSENGVSVPRSPSHATGWDYSPNAMTITFFGAYCDQIKAGTMTNVSFAYGCPGPVVD